VPTASPTPAPPCAPSPSPSPNWVEDPADDQEQIEASAARRPRQVLETCKGLLIMEDQDDKPVRYGHTIRCADPSAVVKQVKFEFESWRTSAPNATPEYDNIEVDCPHPGPSCDIPSIPLHLPLGHSQWIEICASYSGIMYHGGAAAFAQSNQQCSDKFVVNTEIKRYPRLAPPTGVLLREIPFPDPPFRDCTGKKGTDGCSPRLRSGPFRVITLKAYSQQGWTPPAGVTPDAGAGYDVHHIKPLQWGGTNAGANGIIIAPTDHHKLNDWWNHYDVF
jgi:hypothetical protein